MALADRVQDTSTTTGTGNFVLSGSAPAGFRPLSAIPGGVGATFGYVIVNGSEWEAGNGTITAANTFSRAPTASSNGGLLVNFSAGTKSVFHDATAAILKDGLVDPADPGFDIILLAGQSNMAGRGVVVPALDVADGRIWQYGGAGTYANQIYGGVDPLSHPDGGGGLGPGVPFARAYMSTIPTNRRILLVPVAIGATSLVGGSPVWNAGTPGGSSYEFAITQTNAAIAAAQTLYPNSRFVGVAWHQGEQDGYNNVTQAVYAAALKAVIAGWRARITGAASSWFVIGGMLPETLTAHTNYVPIQQAHIQVANETDRCWYVPGPSGHVLSDGNVVHYDAVGQRILGSAMGLAARLAAAFSAVPVAATAVLLSGPSTALVNTASANFTVGTNGTRSAALVVTPTPVAGVTFTPPSVTLPVGSGTATFTATATTAGVKTIAVTNNGGLGNPGSIALTVAAAATVPAAPTIGTAVAGDGYIDVTFTHNSDGGSAVIDSTVTLSTGQTATGTTSPIRVTAPNGTAATATVKDRNAVGLSAASAASNSVTPIAAAYATWNPADKNAALALSNGNKTVTGPNTNDDSWNAVRSTASKTTGKFYFEVLASGGTFIIGVAQADTPLSAFPGAVTGGVGILNDGNLYGAAPNGVFSATSPGDVTGVAMDMDARTLTFYRNGVRNSAASYAVSGAGPLFAMFAIRARTTTQYSHVANFGASPFAYAPPAGFVGLQ